MANGSGFKVVLAVALLAAPLASAHNTISVSPKTIADVLVNPGKGWIVYGWPDSCSAELLSLCSTAYDRYEWSQIEPAEGKFNWKPIDDQIAAWKAAGKGFAFGVMCLNSHTDSTGGYTTPKWVFDAGARYTAVNLKSLRDEYSGSPGVRIVPDFADPIFISKQTHFLAALAKRYDGNSDLAFIDIRAYGNWGENHMWPFDLPDIPADNYRAMIQRHLDLFHHTTLELSAGSHHFDEVLDWASRHGVGIRRDGIGGNSDGSECARSLGHAPAVFEFFAAYTWMKQRGWWDGRKDKDGSGFRLTDCVENGRPSYIGMSQWADAKNLLAAERPLVERLANRMGYHIFLAHAELPSELVIGAPLTLKLEWHNDGVAPIYEPCALAVALLDDQDHPVEVAWPSGSKPAQWPSDKTTSETASCSFTRVKAGTYRLAVGLVAGSQSKIPVIRLANAGRISSGWYPLATIVAR